MPTLKLLAFDVDDLTVLSVQLQDAVARVGDMAFLRKERRFAVLLNRFGWDETGPATATEPAEARSFRRFRTALRFEHVKGVQRQGFSQAEKGRVLALLAIAFEPGSADGPDGVVTLLFAGDAAVRLQVECIEAELRDLGPSWRTRAKPQHNES